MKRILALSLAVFVISIGVVPFSAQASTTNIAEGMGHKAVRGGINLVTGVVEIPMQTYKGYTNGLEPIKNKPTSKAVGTILGLFRGFGHSVGRFGWGGLELFGFWTANPESNEGVGVPFDAQYAWEWGTQYSIFKPSLAEGVKPIGRKLVRGVANGLGGILELPGQTIKGHRDGNTLRGLGKGFWFWQSRQWYGFTDIFTCLGANPADNPGYPFNGEYPWSALSA